MNSVSSNAVAESFGEWENILETYIKGIETKNGKYLSFNFGGYPATYGQSIGNVGNKWKPSVSIRAILFSNNSICFILIDTTGDIIPYNTIGGSMEIYGDTIIRVV